MNIKTKRKDSDKVIHISDVISSILKNVRYESNEDMMKIWRSWNNIVGKTIAENAQPAAFKKNILIVYAVSSTWTHQLQFLKKDIITKVNGALGKTLVKEIKFKIGKI